MPTLPDAAADAAAADAAPQRSTNAVVVSPLVVLVVRADLVTKAMAVFALHPRGLPHEVFGDTVRLTLVYNPGAAFGLYLGDYSRWIFMALTVGALFVLYRLYQTTRPGDTPRVVALALVCAGAVGNLVARVGSARAVVDFIDIGVGDLRWPTFNVADMGVSVGAFLLAWVLWGEDARATAPAATPVAPERERT